MNERRTPYLFNLARRGSFGRLETLLAFIGVNVTPFSGVYPEIHDKWTQFYYDPSHSPFKWISTLAPVLSLFEMPPIRPMLRLGLSGVTWAQRYFKGKRRPEKIYEIPLKLLKYFNIAMEDVVCQANSLGPIPTVFDVLRHTGVSFFFFDWPLICTDRGIKLDFGRYSDRGVCKVITRYLKKDFGLYYFHLWDLDKVIHTYGPRSKQVMDKVRENDDNVREIIGTLQQRYSQVNVVIFSDHGMVEVNKSVDVVEKMQESRLSEDDYLVFLDSTLARFWFKHQRARKEAEETLTSLKGGHILTRQEIKEFRINFPHSKYGELLFLVDPGYLIIPNYFQRTAGVKAMHGYTPFHPDLYGILIASSPNRRQRTHFDHAKLIDVAPTLLDVMGLPSPPSFEGTSLLATKSVVTETDNNIPHHLNHNKM